MTFGIGIGFTYSKSLSNSNIRTLVLSVPPNPMFWYYHE